MVDLELCLCLTVDTSAELEGHLVFDEVIPLPMLNETLAELDDTLELIIVSDMITFDGMMFDVEVLCKLHVETSSKLDRPFYEYDEW